MPVASWSPCYKGEWPVNDDRNVSSFLRDVYGAASDAAEPSAMLRGRTVAELRKKGLIERRSGRKASAWFAAALVVLAFTGGYALGSWSETPSAPGMESLRPGSLAAATEVVQGAGTTYSVALDALVRDLGKGSATDVASARAVVRATTAAQSEAVDRLLGPREIEIANRGPDSATDGQPGVVWF